MIVPSLSVIVLIHNIYLLGQPNLLLLALVLGAFACLRLGREISAGALVATAAAIKAFPILILGYLVYRRMWKATAATVVVLAAWLLIAPLPFRTPAQTVDDLVVWSQGDALHLQHARDRPASAPVVQLQEPVDHGRDAPPAAGRAGRRRIGPVPADARRPARFSVGPGVAAARSGDRSAQLPEAAPARRQAGPNRGRGDDGRERRGRECRSRR